jgi:hypothetical protein
MPTWGRVFKTVGRSRLVPFLAAGTAWFTTGASLPPAPAAVPISSTLHADLIINVPVIIPGYPVIVVPRDRTQRQKVRVQFVAQGDDWAVVNLNRRTLFIASNTRRNYAVELDPGAYYLEITGANRFEVWGSGYLDVGRDNSNIIVVRYSRTGGIQVAGDPYAWISD